MRMGMALGFVNCDGTSHTCIVMSGLQACKINFTRLCKLPNDLARFPWLHRYLVRIIMLHLRIFFHRLGMLFKFFFCTQHHFVLDFARVFNNEFDGFTLFDRDALWFEAHGVKHFYFDSALGIGGFTRFTDGI